MNTQDSEGVDLQSEGWICSQIFLDGLHWVEEDGRSQGGSSPSVRVLIKGHTMYWRHLDYIYMVVQVYLLQALCPDEQFDWYNSNSLSSV